MSQCVSCKGRGFCGRPICPVLRRFNEILKLPKIGLRIEGLSPPDIFVGRHGYPIIQAGPLIPIGESNYRVSGSPHLSMDIGEIIAERTALIRSEAKIEVHQTRNPGKLLEAAQQIAMSYAPVGTEVFFHRPPRGSLRFDGVLAPTGPAGALKDLEITTNPMIPRKVDQFVEDSSINAATAMASLHAAGIGVDHISRLLSIGLLGRDRKLVPTRWSITASDDLIGKSLRARVLDMPTLQGFRLYSGEDLGNHFEILMTPFAYSFELIEIWRPRSLWSVSGSISSDGEGPRGKRDYSNLGGGYYAARLAVLERLAEMGRQASVLAVREVSESYWAPLGVWVVREVARKALEGGWREFSCLSDALEEMGRRIDTPMNRWRLNSKLAARSAQTNLTDFQHLLGA